MLSLAVAGSVFATVFVLILALTDRSGNPARQRLEAMRRGAAAEAPVQPSLSERLIAPATQWLVHHAGKLLPATWLEGQRRRLIMAGEPTTLGGFLMAELVSTTALAGLAFVVVMISSPQPGPTHLLVVLVAGVVGFILPLFWLRQRVGQRQAAIVKSLPDSLDLIMTCVEAGLGLDAALARVAEKVEGPFADELSRALREVALGKLRRDALRELGERTGVPDLITFVNAVIQAEQMGSSIGTVLRVQSSQLRVRRRQRAEEQAHKAPVKMMFPLVLCIFPTLFLVILGPAVIVIMEQFGGGK